MIQATRVLQPLVIILGRPSSARQWKFIDTLVRDSWKPSTNRRSLSNSRPEAFLLRARTANEFQSAKP